VCFRVTSLSLRETEIPTPRGRSVRCGHSEEAPQALQVDTLNHDLFYNILRSLLSSVNRPRIQPKRATDRANQDGKRREAGHSCRSVGHVRPDVAQSRGAGRVASLSVFRVSPECQLGELGGSS